MGTRYIDSSFRKQEIPGISGNRIPINVTEQINPTPDTGWTRGGTLIEQVDAQPPLGEVWSFLGWSIRFTPFIRYDPTAGTAPTITGQLGKIIGGFTTQNPTPTLFDQPLPEPPGFFAQPWHEPLLAIPANSFGLDTLWDGRQDTIPPTGTELLLPPEVPIPPMYSDAPGLTALLHNYALPVPVQIHAGERINIGLWITPSNAENFALSVTAATYVVVVDDGQPQITTWGRDAGMELAH
jgi:hypothetical protein